jgi:putative endonuclease
MPKIQAISGKQIKPKNPHNIRVGRWGEDVACNFLESQGYVILERNFRTPFGELDLIACKDDQTVIVEVKTRSSTQMGYPEEALTPLKASHLLQAADEFMADHPDLPQAWRVDLIAIIGKPANPDFQLEHFENVLSE